MKIKRLIFFIIAPFLLMIIVNTASPAPTSTYQPDACTRYCHNTTCRHTAEYQPLLAEFNSHKIQK